MCLAKLRSRIPRQQVPGFLWTAGVRSSCYNAARQPTWSQASSPKPDQTSSRCELKATFLLLPATARSRSLIQMRTQLGVRSKADFLCCFPDNTRMISCPELLLRPILPQKNPISKQVDAPPLLRSNCPLKTDRSDKSHESARQTPAGSCWLREHTRPCEDTGVFCRARPGSSCSAGRPLPLPLAHRPGRAPQQPRCQVTRLQRSKLLQGGKEQESRPAPRDSLRMLVGGCGTGRAPPAAPGAAASAPFLLTSFPGG